MVVRRRGDTVYHRAGGGRPSTGTAAGRNASPEPRDTASGLAGADYSVAGGAIRCPQSWRVVLEYPLLRLGRCIDTVILTDRAILVLEFKTGKSRFTSGARAQVDDYALDLRDFHSGSRDHPIVPILVVPRGVPRPTDWPCVWHALVSVFDASAATLAPLLQEIEARVPTPPTPLTHPAGNQRRTARHRRLSRRRRCSIDATASPTSPTFGLMCQICATPLQQFSGRLLWHEKSGFISCCSLQEFLVRARRCAA